MKMIGETSKFINNVFHKGIKAAEKYKYADIVFFNGAEKTGEVYMTFGCLETFCVYIIFSCRERNSENQLIMYGAKRDLLCCVKAKLIDEMNEQEIEMIEDFISRKCRIGFFKRKQIAILDKRPLLIKSVVFK